MKICKKNCKTCERLRNNKHKKLIQERLWQWRLKSSSAEAQLKQNKLQLRSKKMLQRKERKREQIWTWCVKHCCRSHVWLVKAADADPHYGAVPGPIGVTTPCNTRTCLCILSGEASETQNVFKNMRSEQNSKWEVSSDISGVGHATYDLALETNRWEVRKWSYYLMLLWSYAHFIVIRWLYVLSYDHVMFHFARFCQLWLVRFARHACFSVPVPLLLFSMFCGFQRFQPTCEHFDLWVIWIEDRTCRSRNLAVPHGVLTTMGEIEWIREKVWCSLRLLPQAWSEWFLPILD